MRPWGIFQLFGIYLHNIPKRAHGCHLLPHWEWVFVDRERTGPCLVRPWDIPQSNIKNSAGLFHPPLFQGYLNSSAPMSTWPQSVSKGQQPISIFWAVWGQANGWHPWPSPPCCLANETIVFKTELPKRRQQGTVCRRQQSICILTIKRTEESGFSGTCV